jgi:hypothetical protein
VLLCGLALDIRVGMRLLRCLVFSPVPRDLSTHSAGPERVARAPVGLSFASLPVSRAPWPVATLPRVMDTYVAHRTSYIVARALARSPRTSSMPEFSKISKVFIKEFVSMILGLILSRSVEIDRALADTQRRVILAALQHTRVGKEMYAVH